MLVDRNKDDSSLWRGQEKTDDHIVSPTPGAGPEYFCTLVKSKAALGPKNGKTI